jgi:hypothetical protein
LGEIFIFREEFFSFGWDIPFLCKMLHFVLSFLCQLKPMERASPKFETHPQVSPWGPLYYTTYLPFKIKEASSCGALLFVWRGITKKHYKYSIFEMQSSKLVN